MMCRTHLLIGMLMVALHGGATVPCSAADDAPKPYTFRSRHYEITTDLDREAAREVALHMDSVFAAYSQRMAGFRGRVEGFSPLYVFAEQREYVRFLAERGIAGQNSGGMFFVNESGQGLATFMRGQSPSQMFSTLQHEGFHQFAFSRISPNLPQWVNEGLAEYFGEAMIVKGKLRIGQASETRLKLIKQLIAAERHIPLRDLLNTSNAEWNARVVSGDERGGVQYAQSWAVCYFLVHGDKGRYTAALERYLRLMNSGVEPAQAFIQAFGAADYEGLEVAWKRFMLAAEPDAVTTAAQRLAYLASGLKLLHSRDVKVSSIEELKQKLREISYTVTAQQHGVITQFRAEDDENFTAPGAAPPESISRKRDKASKLVMTPSKDAALPPEITVEGLPPGAPAVRVKWKKQDDELTYEITFE